MNNLTKPFSYDEIIETVCQYFDLYHRGVVGRAGTKEYIKARQISIDLIRTFMPTVRLIDIGKKFNRNYSTVATASATARKRQQKDAEFRQQYDFLYSKLKTGRRLYQ